jgi:hypothetical protein
MIHWPHALAAMFLASSITVTASGIATDPLEKPIAWGPVRTYSGSYMTGWEMSDFTPNGHTETWWLSGNLGAIHRRIEGHHAVPRNPVFITIEGQLSSPGRYGRLGRFPRELRVIRVISVRSRP